MNPCKCSGNVDGLTHTIIKSCLPDPFEFNRYHFSVISKNGNSAEKSESVCITVTPQTKIPHIRYLMFLKLLCCRPPKLRLVVMSMSVSGQDNIPMLTKYVACTCSLVVNSWKAPEISYITWLSIGSHVSKCCSVEFKYCYVF